MKRLAEFIRSVIPADPYQLVFLGGVVCLVVAHGRRWWPAELSIPGQSSDYVKQVVWYMGTLFLYLIILSSVTGYFVCFWPGKHPIWRVIWLVCAPALLGLGLMFGRVLYVSATPSSILESGGSIFSHKLRWAEATLWKLPEGFQITLLGLLLIAVFTSRMAFGISTLPLRLSKPPFQSEEPGAWRRLQVLIFLLIGPFFLVGSLLSFVSIGVPLVLFSRPPAYLQSEWFGRLATVSQAQKIYYSQWHWPSASTR